MSQNLLDLQIIKRSAQHLTVLESAGFSVSSPSNYGEVPDAVANTGRARQSPMFSMQRNDFTHGDAFWLFLERDQDVVAGCAAQFYDLRDESIESFLRRTSQAQYGRDSDPIAHVAKPMNQKLRGKLIYIGELEIQPNYRGKPAIVFAFLHLLQALAVMKWPDFHAIFAIVPDEHMRLSQGYGFNWKLPKAITWHDPVPKGRLNGHWLMAIDRPDFEHVWSS